MNAISRRSVLLLLLAVLVAPGARLLAQVSPKTASAIEEVAPNGSATLTMTFTYDAAAWAQWRATTGDDPARTRAVLRYSFGANYAFDDFKLERDDLNRTAKIMMHSAVLSELRRDGRYAVQVDEEFRLVNGSGRVWFFSGNLANTISTIKIVLPPLADDVSLINPGDPNQALIYTLPAVHGLAHRLKIAGGGFLGLGLALLGAGWYLGRRPSAL